MANKKTARRALFTSVISLILCCCMLVGTTFAWFTDSVTSANNIIKSGTLDVEMYWADGTKAVPADDSADWKDASTGAIFNYSLWEPGYTEVRHIKIANVGNLALKYQIQIVANGEVSNLADVIDVYYVDPAVEAGVANRTELNDSNKLGTLTEALGGMATTANGNLLAKNDPHNTGKDHEVTLTIALKMQESAGNEYQNKAIGSDFSIVLLATQYTHEEDSFDDQYDKDAEFAIEVKTAEELAKALKVGGDVKLANDITADTTFAIPAGVVVNLDLNGKTISAALHKNDGHVIKNEGNLVLKNGTVSSTANNGGSAIGNNGTAVLENVTLNGAPNADSSWPSYTVNNTGTLTATNAKFTSYHGSVASYGDGAQVTLNNCEIDMAGIPGFTNHGIYTYDNGEVVVNGGIYTNNAADQNATGASVINGAVTVNAGTFNGRIENYYGTPVIKGGTFSADPTRFAKGYEVTNNGDGTWTVGNYKVSTGADLVDAIADGKAVELTQDINLGKIDLTGAIANDVVINANGHTITTAESYGIEVTAGKNVTISNADVKMTKEGDYITYAAGFKIANGDYAGATIKLENCTITMANTDWAYAVNMPASVKNLNLVIDNCTLEGAVAVQCWGDNNTITITDSKLICNYTTSALYTSYCVVLQGEGSNISEHNTLVIDNCEFKYTGVDNFDSQIYSATDRGTGNTVTVTNCTYGEKISH